MMHGSGETDIEKNLFDRATDLLRAHLDRYGMDLNSAGADVVRKMLDEMVITALEFGYPFDPGVEFSIIPGEDVYHFSLGVRFKTGKHTEESFKMLPKWREVDEH